MTILLYDYCELEERASKHLKTWKAWHLVLYICAAIFGVVNYVFLQHTMKLIDNNCVLYPRQLEFREIDVIINGTSYLTSPNITNSDIFDDSEATGIANETTVTDSNDVVKDNYTAPIKIIKRDVTGTVVPNVQLSKENIIIYSGNSTRRIVLDTSRSLFGKDNDCQYAEYMPVLSTVFAITWIVMFTICPGGGYARTGLQQPWRILMPALLFSLVMAGLTGYSFTMTNKGLHAFCEAFFDITNSTNCSSVNEHIERSWEATWSFSGRAATTRAASAAVWASWACATALLFARCLAAPDFQVKKTSVYLKRDPQNKITPYLRRASRHSRSSNSSPNKRDNVSAKSEPTATTELVTVSLEQESVPASLVTTPQRTSYNTDLIEMTHNPEERKEK
ncbi:uncharacterized protein LOC101745117 [Bombyx mori]|uniref:Uncharacterized protein n=1 Tax=Bombyx mori TaxID=7091 RepID=A0A8R2AFZ8_BOMMO|nr:uncharacterized protein LOC101745117 [Bombyx mori]XP_012545003.1 uncharacterized protein LOC101745117 [Bombyx mori]